jgi:hypothetical protein
MLGLFIALQAITPLIHAHAGDEPLHHGGVPHLHQGAHSGTNCRATASGTHDSEIVVEQGILSRNSTLDRVADATLAATVRLSRAVVLARRHADFPIA